MEGHGERQSFEPGAGEDAPGVDVKDSFDGRELTEDEIVVAKHAARLAVEMLEPLIVQFGTGLEQLTESIDNRLAPLLVEAPESRLDSIEARVNAFGMGGETAGDALAVAQYAVRIGRDIAAAISKITGATIPLPPAPQFTGPVDGVTVDGAELAASM